MCSSCGSVTHGSVLDQRTKPAVALVGRTNVGKSTLFTRVSGIYRKMGNWPATTVEVGSADIKIQNREITLIDLPGLSSIIARSPDEKLSADVINSGDLDVIVLVVDCASMARCLYLLSELLDKPRKVIVALSMEDVANRRGIEVSAEVLSEKLEIPVVHVNPRKNQGIENLEKTIIEVIDAPEPNRLPLAFKGVEERVEWVHELTNQISKKQFDRESTSDKADRILTSSFGGPIALLAVLWAVFQGTTSVAAPIQDLLDQLLNVHLANFISGFIGNNALIHGLIINGVIAGVGTLLTFLPVMTIMFFFLSFLEDSGYMARAAVVADRIMRIAGLPGRAILPMLVGFGCNVPAISATRALRDSRHRLIAGLAVPFTACSARLAVYVFVGTVFFGRNAGTVIFFMYLISISLVVGFSYIFKKLFVKDAPREPLLIELPPYKLPTSMLVVSDAWIRVKGFLREAGGIVISTVMVVWALMAIPVTGNHSFADVPVEHSAYGAVSKAVSPIFAPAGFADWHTTGALITGFVAKEVVIASWGQNYAVDESNEQISNRELGKLLKRDFDKSSKGATYPAIWAFLIFLTAYTPCVATVGAQKKEFGTRWALIGVGLQLAIAWLLAVGVFQLGRLFI